MKTKMIKKKLLLPVIIVSSLLLVLGAYAALTLRVENKLTTAIVEGQIKEEFPTGEIDWGNQNTKKVAFTNESNADVFIRISYADYWEYVDASGGKKILSSIDTSGSEIADMDAPADRDDYWDRGDDGWYYYKKVVKPNDSTTEFITGVKFVDSVDEVYKDANYFLAFRMETVQASDEYQVALDAAKELFGKNFDDGNSAGSWTSGKYSVNLVWN